MRPIGYYITCDDAECFVCHRLADWPGFEEWDEPIPIFPDTLGDTPTYCATCGDPIPHALTTEGGDGLEAARSRASSEVEG